ncbi:MAG: signal recognition particle-docking protein FtsY [Hyphomicrobium sp.]|nr:signal recognition particle-docking protein FtsY [Hyphomicrobium sp.]
MTDDKQKSGGIFGRWFGGAKPEPDVRASVAETETAEPVDQSDAVHEDDVETAFDPADGPLDGEALSQVAVDDANASPAPAAQIDKPKSWLQRLTSGLARTSSKLTEGITGLFTKRKLDAATLEDLEDLLIQADLGVETSGRIVERIAKGRFEKGLSGEEVREILASEVETVLAPVAHPLAIDPARKPHVVLVVGVNGGGKTTTIGKLAQKLTREGRSVLLAAGDTFRAAAIDQLKVWGERTGVPVVSGAAGADSSGLAYDALKQAKENGCDVLLIDTAGRLQNKQALMEELEKVSRVIKKLDPTAPHDVVLVLDATTGQNALQQVDVFRERAGVTGLIMTKLDGTARGGILVAIAARFGLPVHAIGVGESVDDLQPFAARDFARAIAELKEF